MDPCPFCGVPYLRVSYDGRLMAYYVICNACGAQGPLSVVSEEDAKAKWNARQK